jgi:hypothetical protein
MIHYRQKQSFSTLSTEVAAQEPRISGIFCV